MTKTPKLGPLKLIMLISDVYFIGTCTHIVIMSCTLDPTIITDMHPLTIRSSTISQAAYYSPNITHHALSVLSNVGMDVGE